MDEEVPQKNESDTHWAVKSALVHHFRSNPAYSGRVETEKKTSDLIGDIRCELSESPSHEPTQFVVEIETPASNKDRLRATLAHTRFGYGVFWVFTKEAAEARTETEELLEEYMASPPSLGIAALEDGELSLGSPITREELSLPTWMTALHELYVPTYDRCVTCYNHGDFKIAGEEVTVYGRPQSDTLFVSKHLENGQRTLPSRTSWGKREFLRGIRAGEIERISPVRGSP